MMLSITPRNLFSLVLVLSLSMTMAACRNTEKHLPPREVKDWKQSYRPSKLVGNWRLSFRVIQGSTGTELSGSGTANVEQPEPGSVVMKWSNMPLLGSSSDGDYGANLRYDPASEKYLFTIKTASGPLVKDLPLSYSEGSGYTGVGALKNDQSPDMEEWTTEVTIDDQSSTVFWTISNGWKNDKDRTKYAYLMYSC